MMRVLQVSTEVFPLLKTGGLADIAGALPAALKAVGCDVRLLLPGFAPILENLRQSSVLAQLVAPWGDVVTLRQGNLMALDCHAYVIDAPLLYLRKGSPYEDPQRKPYADNFRRFALLGWVAAQLAYCSDANSSTLTLPDNWQPQVVHSHDWHAGLAPAYMAYLSYARSAKTRRVACLHTVHNLAYQGVFAASHFSELGLPASAFAVNGLEFYGQISFMKAGLYYADAISTVSPTYAQEIQTVEQGCGLDGLLRAHSAVLSGVLNAVDESVWNPSIDKLLSEKYSPEKLGGKAKCKAALQKEMGLSMKKSAPLFSIVSRLTEQKGMHLSIAAIDDIVSAGGQLVVLGSGDAPLEAALREHATRHPKSVAVRLGYDEVFAHKIFAASDITLVPSRFEPCGLTQMYGLKYGSLPLVHHVGGLADTVVDCSLENLRDETANGFVFNRFTQVDFNRAVRRAFALYARADEWTQVRARAMAQSFSWDTSAAKYKAIYNKIAPSLGI
jgi:starch synthase